MHRIRLRYPWTKQPKSTDEFEPDTIEPQSVQVPEPASDVQASSTGEFVYSRKFNRPTGLDNTSRLSLSVSAWEGKLLSVTLNQSPLDITSAEANHSLTITIDHDLPSHNEIEIVLVGEDQTAARLSGEVQLEINDDADVAI